MSEESKEEPSSLEAVESVINLARIDKATVSACVQPIYMDSQEDKDLYLMEMKPELLDSLCEGQKVVIKGYPSDSAVLCTKSQTFEMKKAETSNMFLLMPSLVEPEGSAMGTELSQETVLSQKVVKTEQTYYELRQCMPKLRLVRALLRRCPYAGRESDNEDAAGKFTLPDFQSNIQASDEEIAAALHKIHACEINGYIRMLDWDYKFRTVSLICDTIDSASHPYNRVPKKEIIDLLEDVEPRQILEQLFSWYANETDELDEDGCKFWELKEHHVCRLFAEVLLRNCVQFNYNDFITAWQDSVPPGMTTDMTQLQGLAIADIAKKPPVIFLFDVEDLSGVPSERLKKLFKTKRKWSEAEILPYMRDLASSNREVQQLLIKNTRCSIVDGIKMYSSKW